MNHLYDSQSVNPAHNLAAEEALLLTAGHEPTLFLWQNAHTVVIGRGQNAWKECRVELLEQEGGRLVRRTTGGGAVYHDMGNLNFSFVMPKKQYDVSRQLSVILKAVSAFGVQAEASGRNDIVLSGSGAKFSGNAFRLTPSTCLHHGTLLVDVDMARLGRYLMPSPEKMAAKGVASVRARVENLSAQAQGMTIASLKDALFDAFRDEYGTGDRRDIDQVLGIDTIARYQEKYDSWDWTYGQTPQFEISLYERFDFGQVELLLSLKEGRVIRAHCYTDANDPDLAERVTTLLINQPFVSANLAQALRDGDGPECAQLADWLASKAL